MNKQDAINLLESSVCGRIRFSFTSVTGGMVRVGPESFQRVAAALRSNQIRFTNEEIPNNTPRGDAGYDFASNTFYIPASLLRQNPIIVAASVIHEAVHVSFDLTRSVIPRIDNEMAAFLAGSQFAENSNASQIFRMHASHQAFARHIPLLQATGTLSDLDIFQLRRAIGSRRAYCKDVWEDKNRYRVDTFDG